MTFEEEKRHEQIKSTYSTVLIIAVFTFVIRLLGFYPLKALAEADVSDILKIAAELLLYAAAVLVPFAVYGKLNDVKFSSFFKRTKKASAGVAVSAGLLLAGLSVALRLPLDNFLSYLSENGFIFTELYPTVKNSLSGQLFYLFAVPLIISAAVEFSLRGFVTGSIEKSSKWFSVITVTALNICLFPEWSDLPMTVISAFVLSWLYMKTGSVVSVFFCSFAYRFPAALLQVLSFNADLSSYIAILAVVGTVAAAVGFLLITFKYKWALGKKAEGEFTKKEGLKALFGSSVLYMLIFVSLVQMFCFYVNKPETDDEKAEPKTEQKADRTASLQKQEKEFPLWTTATEQF